MSEKLSPTQLEVLKATNNSYLHYMGYAGRFNPSAYWFAHGSMLHVRCSTVNKLKDLGLIEIRQKNFFTSSTAHITEKGIAALSLLEPPEKGG